VRNKARRWGVAQAWESSEVTRDFQVAYYGSGWERDPCHRESELRTAARQTRVKVLTMGRQTAPFKRGPWEKDFWKEGSPGTGVPTPGNSELKWIS